ncbi:hypothetical protein CYMTET_44804 [Cymbomonas tetramitiformis]|uniref:Uncharacterized protein n=1 Tax=Cymbomonas tetramitiformis TaxID=36881 RepID=A0AAE0F0B7_9CHLO|nr:hypothetical protein CYMTET_44804 [Cymbomonas tetramitiformis]
MQGCHFVEDFVNVCKHIATFKKMGEFGLHPEVFCDNTSKRSRSAYLTESKTFSLTNAEFNDIVARPCYYCGKKSDPPRHYNGLDRVDTTIRVYTPQTVVSCCGTCNVAKWRWTEQEFLQHCRRVAEFQQSSSAKCDSL